MLQIVKLSNCVGAGSEQTRSDQLYFCPPPPKRNTGDEASKREAERIDKVRSALGE